MFFFLFPKDLMLMLFTKLLSFSLSSNKPLGSCFMANQNNDFTGVEREKASFPYCFRPKLKYTHCMSHTYTLTGFREAFPT